MRTRARVGAGIASAFFTILLTAGTLLPIAAARATDSSEPIGFIDVPAAKASVSGTVRLQGWSIDRNATEGTGVDAVTIYLDGGPGLGTLLGSAAYGLSRPDVGTYFGDPNFNDSGWTFTWNPGTLSPGSHTLYAAMHSSATGATKIVMQIISGPPIPDVHVAPPQAPSAYTTPASAVNVFDSEGLIAALQATAPQDIVLASGSYDNAGPFQNSNGHRIYSATLGGAVLHAGIVMGANWGPGHGLVQGVTFDLTDPAKTFGGGIVYTWGAGTVGTSVLDSTFYGHKLIPAGIVVRQPEGAVVQRVKLRDFTDYGVLVDANVRGLTLTKPVLLEDLDVANVNRPPGQPSYGTAEQCVWLGNTGVLRRALIRSCPTGLNAITADAGSIHEDLDIDDAGVGVEIEHFTTGSIFQRMRIGPNVTAGVNCEWDYGTGTPGSVDNIIQDSVIQSRVAGVNMDDGTIRTTVRRVKFIGQSWAAIGNYRGVNNAYYDLDYSGIAAGAVPVSLDHYPN